MWLKFKAILAVLVLPALALADPTGAFQVKGLDVARGLSYEGTVTVNRTEDVYRVVWLIDGREIKGIALGGAFHRGALTVGPAHADDLMLSVGFDDRGVSGTATMFMQPDQSYQGYVATADRMTTKKEVWTRLDRP